MRRTLEEIRERGLNALLLSLGPADTVRFLQECEKGAGDSAKKLYAWVDRMNKEKLAVAARKRRTPSSKPRR